MVIVKLLVPGRTTILDDCRARAYCACSRCRWGYLDIFTLYLFFPLSPSLSVRRLVGCSGFNGPLRQYFSLYQAVSQREGERKEK